MNRIRPLAIGLASVLALAALVLAAKPTTSGPAGIPAERIGLVPMDVLAVPVPDAVRNDQSQPGERPGLPRWNDQAPPVIPHGIADFVPITAAENACVMCHAVAEAAEGDPTPIPDSHYRDLRNAPEVRRETIAGSRYVCTSCHVPLTDAEPLFGTKD